LCVDNFEYVPVVLLLHLPIVLNSSSFIPKTAGRRKFSDGHPGFQQHLMVPKSHPSTSLEALNCGSACCKLVSS
jgi:hypothetical protein